jgi:hypothetical protein
LIEEANKTTCEDGNNLERWMTMAKANPVQIQKHLKGVDYPASKQELIQHAQKQGADQKIISLLEQLPENEEYNNPTGVNKAIGEID